MEHEMESRALDKLAILRCTLTTLVKTGRKPRSSKRNTAEQNRNDRHQPTPSALRKIGHVGIYCRDLPKMVDFYTARAGLQELGVNEKGNEPSALRRGFIHRPRPGEDARRGSEKGRGRDGRAADRDGVANLDALKRIRKYLVAQGVNVRARSSTKGRAKRLHLRLRTTRKETGCSFFSDMDRIGWDGKSRPKEQWKRFEVED